MAYIQPICYLLIFAGLMVLVYKIYAAGKTEQVKEDQTNVIKNKDKEEQIDARPTATPDDILGRMSNDNK